MSPALLDRITRRRQLPPVAITPPAAPTKKKAAAKKKPPTKKRRPKRVFTATEIKQAQAWAKEGVRYWEIADRLGVTPSKLSETKILPPGNKGRRRQFDWDEAQRLFDEGHTMSAIARHFGVNPTAIRRAIDAPYRVRYDGKAKRTMKRMREENGSGVYGGPCYLCNRECDLTTLVCAPCKKAWERGQDELLKEAVTKK